MDILRLSGTLGAEILNVNLNKVITTEIVDEIKQHLCTHKVVFLRRQFLSQEQHLSLAKLFGEVEPAHPLIKNGASENNIFEIDYNAAKSFDPYKQYNARQEKGGRGLGVAWHTDVTFSECPPRFSILNAVTMPKYGGDTVWADQTEAFYSLSKTYQNMLIGLTATHASMQINGEIISSDHPVVISHPNTQEPCLYVNQSFTTKIRKLTRDESQNILDYLYRHCCQQQFTVRYHWTQGDIAIWDNRNTQHAVIGDFGSSPRKIQRVTIKGDEPRPYGIINK